MVSEQTCSRHSEFLAGAAAELPLLLGVVPFGMIYGAVAVQLHVPPLIAFAMSPIILGGSSQFVAAPLIAASAPAIIIVITIFVVNLRHALYSASIAPYLDKLTSAWKMLLAYLLTDEAYAVAISHYYAESQSGFKHWYLLGTGLTLWTSWQLSTAIGLFLGGQIPPEWSLEFALPLTFIAIVVPMLRTRAAAGAAVVAGIVSVMSAALPYKLGLMVAAFLGIFVGLATESMLRHGAAGEQPSEGIENRIRGQ